MNHPGTANLYDLSLPVAEGGLTFRARFGVEYEGENLLAEGVYSKGSEIEDGYPEFTMAMLEELGWDADLTPWESRMIDWVAGFVDQIPQADDAEVGEKEFQGERPSDYKEKRGRRELEDRPLGRHPARRHRPWLRALRATPRRARSCGPSPTRCRCTVSRSTPIAATWWPTTRPTTTQVFWRVPTLYASIQARDYSQEYPIILTSGRLVEYEGGGDETRSNPWLAELQQEMFVEINPRDANDRGVRDGSMVWVEGARAGPGAGARHGHAAGRGGRGLHALPLRRPLSGRRPARAIPRGRRPLRARRVVQTPPRPTATTA